jgi:hypothetical protein
MRRLEHLVGTEIVGPAERPTRSRISIAQHPHAGERLQNARDDQAVPTAADDHDGGVSSAGTAVGLLGRASHRCTLGVLGRSDSERQMIRSNGVCR